MQQVTRGIYIVDDGENITIEIEAMAVGKLATFVVDGDPKKPDPGAPRLTFKFAASLQPGEEHHGMITCFFPPRNTPDNAKFQVRVSGSGGGGQFEGSDIKKTDPIWTRSIEFMRPS